MGQFVPLQEETFVDYLRGRGSKGHGPVGSVLGDPVELVVDPDGEFLLVIKYRTILRCRVEISDPVFGVVAVTTSEARGITTADINKIFADLQSAYEGWCLVNGFVQSTTEVRLQRG